MNSSFQRIMIVDDEKDLCLLLSKVLKKKYKSVERAYSLQDAHKQIHKFLPHILLLDYNLPDGKGTEIISILKQHIPFLKVVMMSARHSPEDVERAYSHGADYFIPKPFNLQVITETLEAISENGRLKLKIS